MARAPRRGRGGRTSPRTILVLSLLAVALFAVGEAILFGRSEQGLVWRARLGLPVNERALARSISRTVKTTFNEFGKFVGHERPWTTDTDVGA